MNLVDLLREQAKERPSAAALVDPRSRRTFSFAELEDLSAKAAGLLVQSGLRPGDNVLVLLPMGAELYVALLALFRLGMVAVFPDPFSGLSQVERCCALSRPAGLIALSKFHALRLISPALNRIPLKFAIGMPVPGAISWRTTRQAEPAGVVPCPADSPVLLTFTSGSSGQPKAVMRTHGFLLEQHRVLQASLRVTPNDVVLVGLPVFVLSHLGCGAASVIPDADLRRPGHIVPGPIARQVKACGVTVLEASPAFLDCLTRRCLPQGETLPGLKKVYVGGAPVFPRLLDRIQEMAPNAEVVAIYGSTEAEPIALIPRNSISTDDRQAMLSGRGLLVGRPVPSIQLTILPDRWGRPIGPFSSAAFTAEQLPPGQPGEIVVAGNHILRAYAEGQNAEGIKFQAGDTICHRTGDTGLLDEQGRLWLLGRCAARIVDDRGVLYPFSVEAAVSEDPEIARAALFAREGRRVLAIEPGNAYARPNVESLTRQLAWARLDTIELWKRIPVDKRHNAKVDYAALLQLNGGRRAEVTRDKSTSP